MAKLPHARAENKASLRVPRGNVPYLACDFISGHDSYNFLVSVSWLRNPHGLFRCARQQNGNMQPLPPDEHKTETNASCCVSPQVSKITHAMPNRYLRVHPHVVPHNPSEKRHRCTVVGGGASSTRLAWLGFPIGNSASVEKLFGRSWAGCLIG